ncbi:MAG: hypothetical protein V4618_00895 [Pseudomonadota bacterium]
MTLKAVLKWFIAPRPNPLGVGDNEPILKAGRGFTFEVAGESYYQEALSEICGGACSGGHKLVVDAYLTVEHGNPHDQNAVAVHVGGHIVGRVPKSIALTVRNEVLAISSTGAARCKGKIVGGWKSDDGDTGHFGIKLSVSRPLKLEKAARD